MMNHDIFISYSSKQKSIADGVCHYLEENGFKCWMAPRDIPVGSDYGDLIEEAIKTSKVVVLVFSEAASISKWVKGEINVAFTEDKPILPFRIDETEVKGGFRVMLNQMHWIDAFPQFADRLPDLLKSICGLLNRQPQKVQIEDGPIQDGSSNPNKDATKVSAKPLTYPEGAINGVFSVSPTKKVYFSKGNLQFQITTEIWRFAEQQFDIIGSNNRKVNKYNDGWMDLFGWGTGDDPIKHMYSLGLGFRQFSDWGNNVISNGGKQPKLWHAMTIDEWKYLIEERETSSGVRFAHARVGVRNGLILLPDAWNYAYPIINPNGVGDYRDNVIDSSKWVKLESEGVVFLPAAGFQDKISASCMQSIGEYWSATDFNGLKACMLFFNGSFSAISDVSDCDNGLSVRLVCDA